MQKNLCYIFWDLVSPEEDGRVYLQCEECFNKNKKGMPWSKGLLKGLKEVKCDLCSTIIYKRERKRNNEKNKTDN